MVCASQSPSFFFQAPASMKSVLQAGWLLTVAFGNVIVLIVAQSAPLAQVWNRICYQYHMYWKCFQEILLSAFRKFGTLHTHTGRMKGNCVLKMTIVWN